MRCEIGQGSGMPKLALLAGGLATRLRAVADGAAKSMVLVAGEPFIAHQLRLLARQGITQVIVCCGHLSEQIQSYVGDGSRFECRVEYSSDGPAPLGTGGAVKKAIPMLGERFLVMYGDSYLPSPLRPVWDSFLQTDRSALMAVFRNEGRWDTSNVEFRSCGTVRYSKRALSPAMRHIDYGVGCFRAEAFASFPQQRNFDLSEVYERLAVCGQLAGHEVMERFYEIGSPSGLGETDAMLREHLATEAAAR